MHQPAFHGNNCRKKGNVNDSWVILAPGMCSFKDAMDPQCLWEEGAILGSDPNRVLSTCQPGGHEHLLCIGITFYGNWTDLAKVHVARTMYTYSQGWLTTFLRRQNLPNFGAKTVTCFDTKTTPKGKNGYIWDIIKPFIDLLIFCYIKKWIQELSSEHNFCIRVK